MDHEALVARQENYELMRELAEKSQQSQILMKKQQLSYDGLLRVKLEKEVIETSDSMMSSEQKELQDRQQKLKV